MGDSRPLGFLGCPLCGARSGRCARYPREICRVCVDAATDDVSSPLRLFNQHLGGGFMVLRSDGVVDTPRSAVAMVRGVRCEFSERYMGGVVGQPLPAEQSERIAGCLLGGAVGDALGAPVEFASLAAIQDMYGELGVRGYESPGGLGAGAITDDTQMTLFTAEGLLVAKTLGASTDDEYLESIAAAYQRWMVTQSAVSVAPAGGWLLDVPSLHARRAPGNTCLGALAAGVAVPDSKGCGGAMRVAPVGLAFEDPFRLACRAAGLTHGHPSGYLAAGAFAALIAMLRVGCNPQQAVTEVGRRLETEPDGAEVLDALTAARRLASSGTPTPQRVERLGGGWVADEALAIAVYCLLACDDIESGLRLAVNHSGDSDSTASMAGQLLGARHGAGPIPWPLVEGLECAPVLEAISRDLASAFQGAPHTEWSDRYVPK